jgi:hypothetical protein
MAGRFAGRRTAVVARAAARCNSSVIKRCAAKCRGRFVASVTVLPRRGGNVSSVFTLSTRSRVTSTVAGVASHTRYLSVIKQRCCCQCVGRYAMTNTTINTRRSRNVRCAFTRRRGSIVTTRTIAGNAGVIKGGARETGRILVTRIAILTSRNRWMIC